MKITSTLLSTVSLYVLLGAIAPSHLNATKNDGEEVKTTTTTTVAAKDAQVQLGNVVDEDEITTNTPAAGEESDGDSEEEEDVEPKQLSLFWRFLGYSDSNTSNSDEDQSEDEGEKEIPNAAKKITPQIPTSDAALQEELEKKLAASKQALSESRQAVTNELAKAMGKALEVGPEGMDALSKSVVGSSDTKIDMTKSLSLYVDEKNAEETPPSDDENAAHQAAVTAPVVSEADVEKVLARVDGWGWGSTIAYWTIAAPVTVPYEIGKGVWEYIWGSSSHQDSEARVGGVDSLLPPSNVIVPPRLDKVLPEETKEESKEALPPVIQGVVDNVFDETTNTQTVEVSNDQTVAAPKKGKPSKNQRRRNRIAEKAKEAAAKEAAAKEAAAKELIAKLKEEQERNAKLEQELKEMNEALERIQAQQKDKKD